ncbi:hypothetical protein IJG92_01530 [Candidatus Saccharibacteria bacterium]|nr:hypothetical protein [Candidatus Saccharibacteria bacterium]
MANNFIVSPMLEKISLKAGETYTGSILIANPKDATEDFYYKISTSPYSVIGENYIADFETISDWSRILEWTTLEDTEGTLKPNETKRIFYTIEVPKNAPAGGQYLKIGVTSNAAASGSGGAVQDVFEIASLVFAEIDGETTRGGRILEGKIPDFVTSSNPAVTAKFTNTGNVHETATTALYVKNLLGGGEIYPQNGENPEMESIIMPLSTRVVSRQIPNLPVVGIFEVKETISYRGDTMDVTSVMVVCPAWFILLILATIASILGMVFYGRHLKRKKFKKQLHSEKTNAKIEP